MNYTSDNAESAVQVTPEATALNVRCDIRLFKHTQAWTLQAYTTPAGKSLSDQIKFGLRETWMQIL